MKRLSLVLIWLLLINLCPARTIIVDDNGPADFSNIQAAINYSWNGDIIMVKPGTYNQSVSFNGRAITLTSEDPNNPLAVQSTIITGNSNYSGTFDFGENTNSVLTGFTITGYGIFCYSASPTISKNIIRNCTTDGISGQAGSSPIITDNTISFNDLTGVYQCDGLITRNIIYNNNGGIAYCNGQIIDNIITGNYNTNTGNGGGLYFCNGKIIKNIITDNYATFRGGGLYGCSDHIANNIIAGNSAGQLGGGLHSCTKIICNNTIVGNMASNSGGGLCDCTGSVYNNIIAFNKANSVGGIDGLCDNSYNCFWMNEGGNFGIYSKAGPGDIIDDPLFAINGYWDPNGTTDKTNDFWVDGDYHPKSEAGRWNPVSRTWIIDEVTSRCIDAGDLNSDWTEELWPHGRRINIGVYGGTTEASMSLSNIGNIADLNGDGWVDYKDLSMCMDMWLSNEMPVRQDIDRDGSVNFNDFAILANNWQLEPPLPTPPIPNPMTWETEAYATSAYSIAMVATTATSTDGSGVEYYFQDRWYPQYNSGWISFEPTEKPRWEVKNLLPETLYWYWVKARNKGNLLETDWSEVAIVSTLPEDITPPTPNPATWATEPYATSKTSIKMVATTANDDSGVEYYFECTSHPIYSSNWQDSPIYEVSSLPKDVYSFIHWTRDKSPNHNTAGHSLSVTVDLKPPSPDPMQWATGGKPRKEHRAPYKFNDYWAVMKAAEAMDDAGVEYKFVCSDSRFSSGGEGDTGPEWRNEDNVDGDPREYEVKIGQSSYWVVFYVIARDRSPSHNMTGASSLEPWQ